MRDPGNTSLRRAARLRWPAVILCLLFLAGCRFGGPTSFFEDEGAIERGIASLKGHLAAPVRVLNATITPDELTIRVQDKNDRKRVEEWQLSHIQAVAVSWERVSGPRPYEATLVNPDLEANLFELDEVDFAFAGKLARAAIERAALSDRADVVRMEIARQVFIVPTPASGEIRWTVDVSSGRESVQVFADARGAITGKNVDGTEQAKKLDILRQLELVGDAKKAFGYVLGTDPIITAVNISPRYVGFDTVFSDPEAPVQVSGSLSARRVYVWNLNGLRRTTPAINADAALGKTRYVFGIDDVDWSALPKIAAAAPARLEMPQGRVTGIELSKPLSPTGAAQILWKVEVTDENKEKGYVLVDLAGSVKQLVQPQSRRTPVDWFNPKTMADTLARLANDFGRDRQFAEITFMSDKVVITAQNHMEPNAYSQILLTDSGLERFGTAALSATKNVPFRIDELKALTAEQLIALEAKTIETLKLPPKSLSSITLGRGSLDPSPNGNVTIEIRAEERPGGRAGRINYELDGTVIKTYMP